MKKHYRHESDCLNCGTVLEGKFCHNCGQENLQIKESFGHMMNHAISDYFHFDHQFFHTLKPLFFKPGMLTNEYMAGRRVQFLHPVKMYIFISLVYFLLVFKENKEAAKIEHQQITTEKTKDSVNRQVEKNINENKNLTPEQKKIALTAVGKSKGYHVRKNIPVSPTIKKQKDSTADEDNDDTVASTGIGGTTTDDTTYAQYLATQKKLPPADRDGWLERYYNQKAFALNDHRINKKELIKEGIKHNFPKMMFILLPLFALILKIAFWRNKKFYVEHLIYSFHLHCFVFLFLTIIMLLKMVIPDTWTDVNDWINSLSYLIILWYIYRSLRVVYNRSRGRTISKMFGMSIAYSIAFGICLMLLILITTLTVV